MDRLLFVSQRQGKEEEGKTTTDLARGRGSHEAVTRPAN